LVGTVTTILILAGPGTPLSKKFYSQQDWRKFTGSLSDLD